MMSLLGLTTLALCLTVGQSASSDRQLSATGPASFDELARQVERQLPAPLVVRYSEERPVQTLVLLTNAIDRDPVLLHLLTMTSGMPWYRYRAPVAIAPRRLGSQ
jgi:hypothetical protein